VNLENDDQDSLQLKDELDSKWVNLWQKATKKKTAKTPLTIACIPAENTIVHQSRCQIKKTQ
jgi:hypothetical protein